MNGSFPYWSKGRQLLLSSDPPSPILASWQQKGTEGFTESLTLKQHSISCCFSPLNNPQIRVVTHNPMFYILLLFATYMFWAGNLLLRVTVKFFLVATVHLILTFIKQVIQLTVHSLHVYKWTQSLACSPLVKWEYRCSRATFKSFGSIGWLCIE